MYLCIYVYVHTYRMLLRKDMYLLYSKRVCTWCRNTHVLSERVRCTHTRSRHVVFKSCLRFQIRDIHSIVYFRENLRVGMVRLHVVLIVIWALPSFSRSASLISRHVMNVHLILVAWQTNFVAELERKIFHVITAQVEKEEKTKERMFVVKGGKSRKNQGSKAFQTNGTLVVCFILYSTNFSFVSTSLV